MIDRNASRAGRPISSDCDSDGEGDTNLEILKLSQILSAKNVCRHYISAKICSEKTLISLISLQNYFYTFNGRKIK